MSVSYCLECKEFAPLGGGKIMHMPWCRESPRYSYEELWKIIAANAKKAPDPAGPEAELPEDWDGIVAY